MIQALEASVIENHRVPDIVPKGSRYLISENLGSKTIS